MIIESTFKPAWWLSHAHAQTLYPTLTRRLAPPIDRRERFELSDGDFIDLAWAINGLHEDAPLVVCLHGLGGSVRSPYVAGLLHAVNRCGFRGVLMHFRGASDTPNRLPRAYHSGDTADLAEFFHLLMQREPSTKKAAVGVSLGGNVLLKWLGESGVNAPLRAAVAVSVPFELRKVSDRINQGFSRIYQAYLLKRLRKLFANKREGFTGVLPEAFENIDSSKCFWTFDDRVTAPLHGFAHVHAYYREASSRQHLINIATPTLILQARDDPFMTPDVLPRSEELSEDITMELSAKGGHVGFISGNVPVMPTYWLEGRVLQFLKAYLAI